MVMERRIGVRVLRILAASALAVTASCSTGGAGHTSRHFRSTNTMPVVTASQVAEEMREQAAAEKQPFPVLRIPLAHAGAPLAWRTLATSHGDRRLLLEVRLSPCDRLLGILVHDTPDSVRVEPLVLKAPSTTVCNRMLLVAVGYVHFPAPLGTRLTDLAG